MSCLIYLCIHSTGFQITGWIDKGLNEKAYIIPGLGDFGERRYVLDRSFRSQLLADYFIIQILHLSSRLKRTLVPSNSYMHSNIFF
jgi:hypothetical protein